MYSYPYSGRYWGGGHYRRPYMPYGRYWSYGLTPRGRGGYPFRYGGYPLWQEGAQEQTKAPAAEQQNQKERAQQDAEFAKETDAISTGTTEQKETPMGRLPADMVDVAPTKTAAEKDATPVTPEGKPEVPAAVTTPPPPTAMTRAGFTNQGIAFAVGITLAAVLLGAGVTYVIRKNVA